ncbi:hypothetical protein EYC84_007113 [Monilinia fructicola]|uniref:Uncharacterized protein n=1 Tax=Monilinia fructicola TaxID=38448 RepID=A0A5M9K8B5_MONFR|nr:hypothetical protein EYC84_007113 [Monilinia fructicola]
MVKSAPNPAPAWTNDYIPALTKEIINGQHILHVSFLTKDSEYPTVCYLVGQILKYKSNPEVLYVHGHVQEPVLGRLKGLEKGDLDLSVSIAASTIHSHYLGFSGFATGFAFADTVLNGTARTDVDYVTLIKITPNAQKSHTHSVLQVFGLEVQNDVEDKELCKKYWEGAIPVWEKLGQPISGKNNLPEGKQRVPPKYVTDFIESENARKEAFAKQAASAEYPWDYPRH